MSDVPEDRRHVFPEGDVEAGSMSVAGDCAEIARKVEALGVIFTAPLWPKREALSETGQALFDAIVADAKPYSLACVDGRFDDAAAILGRWGNLGNAFIDATRIVGDEAGERMVRVFRHYADAMADFSKIVPR